MRRRRIFAVAFVVAVLALMVTALAPELQGQAPVSPLPSGLPFRHLLQGQTLLIPERGFRVLRTADAWRTFWTEAGLSGGPPVVDFGNTVVVAVLMGERPTGGYAIRVSSVVRIGPEVLLTLVESRPGTGCAPPPGPTEPFDIVAFPAGAAEMLPLYRSQTSSC